MTEPSPASRGEATLSANVRITLWQYVKTLTAQLDDAHPRTDHEIACRVMKLAEKTGKAVGAYFGKTGHREGDRADALADELCGVIITAMVALTAVTGDVPAAALRLEDHLFDRFPALAARIAPGPAEEWWCECCGDAWFGPPPDDDLCSPCRNAGIRN